MNSLCALPASVPDLAALAAAGYWYCVRCERIVTVPDARETPATCPRCHHRTAEWQAPVDVQCSKFKVQSSTVQ